MLTVVGWCCWKKLVLSRLLMFQLSICQSQLGTAHSMALSLIISLLISFRPLLIFFVSMYGERDATGPTFILAVHWDLPHGNYSFFTCSPSMQCSWWHQSNLLEPLPDGPSFSNLPPKCSNISCLCKWLPLICSLSQHDEHALCAASCCHQLEEAF